MSATIRWGVIAGVLAVAADTVYLAVTRDLPPDGELASNIGLLDTIANIVLFSLAGLYVGRETGVHRAGAEAGVLAGAIAGLAALITPELLPGSPLSPTTTREMIGLLAWNVALGGILALFGGWIGSRAAATRQGR